MSGHPAPIMKWRGPPEGGTSHGDRSVVTVVGCVTFAVSTNGWMIMLNANIQIRELWPPQAVEPDLVKRMNGILKKLKGEIPFTAGPHCEVWKGVWEKEGGEGISGEKVGGEGVEADGVKVSLGFITSIPLKWLFQVALKTFRPVSKRAREDAVRSSMIGPVLLSHDVHEKLERELPVWLGLRHENVLPFYGVVICKALLPSILMVV